MFKTIEVRRISAGSVYKLIAIGFLSSVIPFCTLPGIFSLFGADTLSWNGKPVSGISGLLASPFIGAFIGFVFIAICGSLCVLGQWVYCRFLTFTISIQEFSDPGSRMS